MLKYITIGLMLLGFISSYAVTFSYGRTFERNKTEADKYADLAKSTQSMVQVFETLSAQTAELNAVQTNDTVAGDYTQRAFSILRDSVPTPGRKPSANP